MSVIKEILQRKREEVEKRKSFMLLPDLKARAKDVVATRPFKTSVTRKADEPIKLVAELKKASPSEGVIRANFSVPEIISIYDKKEVGAISVLTDKRYFEGSLDYLGEVRELTKRPLLRKDFIIDDYQVYESRAGGADAILLIVACLDKSQLIDFQGLAKELSLGCLVEVHNLKELDTALYSGAEIIGINNRDLNTLQTSLHTTFELLKDIPDDKVVISESGINTRADVKAIESTKADAILVGTALMRAKNIEAKIDELLG